MNIANKIPASDWSFTVRNLVDAALKIEPNELWTYETISEVAGRRMKGEDSRLQNALTKLSKVHGIEFRNVRGDGYMRMDDPAIVESFPGDHRRVKGVLKRSGRKSANIRDFNALPNSHKLAASVHMAQLGIMELFSEPKAQRVYAKQIEEHGVVDHDAVLSLFRPVKQIGRNS